MGDCVLFSDSTPSEFSRGKATFHKFISKQRNYEIIKHPASEIDIGKRNQNTLFQQNCQERRGWLKVTLTVCPDKDKRKGYHRSVMGVLFYSGLINHTCLVNGFIGFFGHQQQW